MLNPTVTVPLLPGFSEPVDSSQHVFRSLLNALAHPGSIQVITDIIAVPPPLNGACGVAGLTLLDGETRVWLQPRDGIEVVRSWLQFHCGCPWTTTPSRADFAIISDPLGLESLQIFNWGEPEVPEQSTTLLVQVEALNCCINPEQLSLQSPAESLSSNTQSISQFQYQALQLQGPGIEHKQILNVRGIPLQFWQELALNQTTYPLGLDVFLLSSNGVVGLPRTTIIRPLSSTLD